MKIPRADHVTREVIDFAVELAIAGRIDYAAKLLANWRVPFITALRVLTRPALRRAY